jgi:hypothetical protein
MGRLCYTPAPCNDTSLCSPCPPGSIFTNGNECLITCPSGTSYNPDLNTCDTEFPVPCTNGTINAPQCDVCPEGQIFNDTGNCVNENIPIPCGPTNVQSMGVLNPSCVPNCPVNTVLIDNICKTGDMICNIAQYYDIASESCVMDCPTGTYFIERLCYTPTNSCAQGEECEVCPPGLTLGENNSRVCYPICSNGAIVPLCEVCPPNKYLNSSNNCVEIPIDCDTALPGVESCGPDQEIVCENGFVLVANVCVSNIANDLYPEVTLKSSSTTVTQGDVVSFQADIKNPNTKILSSITSTLDLGNLLSLDKNSVKEGTLPNKVSFIENLIFGLQAQAQSSQSTIGISTNGNQILLTFTNLQPGETRSVVFNANATGTGNAKININTSNSLGTITLSNNVITQVKAKTIQVTLTRSGYAGLSIGFIVLAVLGLINLKAFSRK